MGNGYTIDHHKAGGLPCPWKVFRITGEADKRLVDDTLDFSFKLWHEATPIDDFLTKEPCPCRRQLPLKAHYHNAGAFVRMAGRTIGVKKGEGAKVHEPRALLRKGRGKAVAHEKQGPDSQRDHTDVSSAKVKACGPVSAFFTTGEKGSILWIAEDSCHGQAERHILPSCCVILVPAEKGVHAGATFAEDNAIVHGHAAWGNNKFMQAVKKSKEKNVSDFLKTWSTAPGPKKPRHHPRPRRAGGAGTKKSTQGRGARKRKPQNKNKPRNPSKAPASSSPGTGTSSRARTSARACPTRR